jgi:tRNA1(Val) A37 N6-methylase TrmN6
MDRHETPRELAVALARHAPRLVGSILDPCVGTGALLEPLLRRLQKAATNVVCIDADQDVLGEVRTRFEPMLGRRLSLVCQDFLAWPGQSSRSDAADGFDCVVMNPPFAARRADWVRVRLNSAEIGRERSGPLEAAFVAKAVRELRPGGQLLAIVPSSLVSSARTAWLRRALLEAGAVRCVHELPRYTFSGVESRVYLFLFEKAGEGRPIVLRNHDLAQPQSMRVNVDDLGSETRLDYGFHRANRSYRAIRRRSPRVLWVPLSRLATIYRGEVNSPARSTKVLHTCDYRGGFWWSPHRRRPKARTAPDRRIRAGDILVKRVGRRCSSSIGPVVGHRGGKCSDCVLIIRPNYRTRMTELLFALRVLLASDEGAPLVEQGTGAAYLTERRLRDIDVPIGLSARFPQIYASYTRAIRQRQLSRMTQIENRVRRRLQRVSRSK